MLLQWLSLGYGTSSGINSEAVSWDMGNETSLASWLSQTFRSFIPFFYFFGLRVPWFPWDLNQKLSLHV